MSTVEQARKLARENALQAMQTAVNLARAPNRNAIAQLAAARLVLEMAGVTAAMTAEQALETLIEAMRPHVGPEVYAKLIRAHAAVRGVVLDRADSAPAKEPH